MKRPYARNIFQMWMSVWLGMVDVVIRVLITKAPTDAIVQKVSVYQRTTEHAMVRKYVILLDVRIISNDVSPVYLSWGNGKVKK